MERLFPDPFLKTQNQAYLWFNSLKFYTICFYLMQSCGLSKYIETKLHTTFSKNKKRRGTSLFASFSARFSKKIFLLLYSIN